VSKLIWFIQEMK
jgi:hypothetical protein